MQLTLNTDASGISTTAAKIALVSASLALLALALLHVISPEYDPSWRMVSEYALGAHKWALSLMFFAWGAGSWALAATIRTQLQTRGGKIGWYLLLISGLGEMLAIVFDVKDPLHGLATTLGVPTLAVGAVLIGKSLSRNAAWQGEQKTLMQAAHLPWLSFLAMVVAMVIMITTYTKAGGVLDPAVQIESLPDGTVAFNGWVNRLLIVAYCGWLIVVARAALRVKDNSLSGI
jgi:Protein of unknown function (DUF998)